MSGSEKDDIPMLSNLQLSDEPSDSRSQPFRSRNRSVSMSMGGSYDGNTFVANHFVGFTGPLRSEKKTPMVQMSGPLRTYSLFHHNQNATVLEIYDPEKERNYSSFNERNYSSFNEKDQDDSSDDDYAGANEHLYRSGPLGVCNDPYCTTCPTYSKFDEKQHRSGKAFGGFDSKLHNILYGDAKGWSGRFFSSLQSYVPGVMNPHAKPIKRWNQFFVISCLVSIFVDPLFFFLLYVHKENKCISINWGMTTIIVSFRSLTDLIYLVNMLLQFRLAYVNPESTVVGVGDLIDHPKKIANHYLKGYFLLDLFIVFPIPQVLILMVVPKHLGSSGANYAKNLLRAAILAQYIPRLFRFLPLLVGQSAAGFTFESAWADFIINLLTFALSGHVVGSCWYLLGLQRVNQCLQDACRDSPINSTCKKFIDCGHGYESSSSWCTQDAGACKDWKENIATKCFEKDGFPYGIYQQAVNLTREPGIVRRYIYSLFWGFQQISTLAGNQVPSYFVWEVLFTMAIIGLGLLLFALLIGNMQNFLQALGQRKVEMSLRRRDVEQWMSHRRLPEQLKRRIRQAERYNWAATRGVNEETLMGNLPEDLQRDVRRHLFKFVQQIRIFSFMDEPILDSICERLRQKTYIKGSKILDRNGIVEKMVFIVRGKMESVGEDGSKIPLFEGDACGEELITWCLENFSVNQGINKDARKLRILGHRLSSNRTVTCLTNVEAFTLRSTDIEEVTARFSRFLRNPRVQGAIRYFSTYWRDLAARRIQVAWKRRIKRSSLCKCQLCQD